MVVLRKEFLLKLAKGRVKNVSKPRMVLCSVAALLVLAQIQVSLQPENDIAGMKVEQMERMAMLEQGHDLVLDELLVDTPEHDWEEHNDRDQEIEYTTDFPPMQLHGLAILESSTLGTPSLDTTTCPWRTFSLMANGTQRFPQSSFRLKRTEPARQEWWQPTSSTPAIR